ncbi:MAG TPA: DUF3516 domain-containing protein, partial [Anaeromyxobacteraceae bacterium]|nr:DUF3516 domain-containing protein [Anaeromyxobacteraceae bacterium]
EHVIENKRLAEKAAAGKKVVKRQPPQRGYVHWDRSTFERLRVKEPEPLVGRFDISFGLVLGLLQSETTQRGGGYARLVEMIGRAHETPYGRSKLRRAAAARFRALRRAGLVQLRAIEGYRGRYLRLASGLQRDFSLHHTLALWLLDTLQKVPRERETYALDVLTLCESILENPEAVLWKQLDVARGRAVAEMKAKGMEYDERMLELEKVEYPKPLADFVYGTFNEFAALHPWVAAENIRPKSVAREMVERYMTFNDYVGEYGLERSEGVLLRYLSDTYRTLSQTVPEGYRDERLDDTIAFLRATVRGVDASLLDEWERMQDPAYCHAPPDQRAALSALPPRPVQPDDDPRAFASRVRNELHRLLVAIAGKKWNAAAEALFQPDGAWPPGRIEEELAAYYAEHPSIDTRPTARLPHNTFIEKAGPRAYVARQRIVDEEGEVDWVITCSIDLANERPGDAPLIELMSVGV